MPRRRSPEAQALFEFDQAYTVRLEEIRDEVLSRVARIERQRVRNVHSFHGLIGSKNNTYVDSVRTKFTAPDDFKARWMRGLRGAAEGGFRWDKVNKDGWEKKIPFNQREEARREAKKTFYAVANALREQKGLPARSFGEAVAF